MAVWVTAGCDSRKRLTDGRISRDRLARITPLKDRALDVAEKLVELRLWKRTKDGYVFHDWEDVQETKAEVQERRTRSRIKKRKQRLSPNVSPGDKRGDNPGDSPGDAQRDSQGDTPGDSPGLSPVLNSKLVPLLAGARGGMGRAGEGSGSDPDPDDNEPASAAAQERRRVWSIAYQKAYSAKFVDPCAVNPKFEQHLSALVRWSLQAELSDAECCSIVTAFFADNDAKVTEGRWWIGYLVPRLTVYRGMAPGNGSRSFRERMAAEKTVDQ